MNHTILEVILFLCRHRSRPFHIHPIAFSISVRGRVALSLNVRRAVLVERSVIRRNCG